MVINGRSESVRPYARMRRFRSIRPSVVLTIFHLICEKAKPHVCNLVQLSDRSYFHSTLHDWTKIHEP